MRITRGVGATLLFLAAVAECNVIDRLRQKAKENAMAMAAAETETAEEKESEGNIPEPDGIGQITCSRACCICLKTNTTYSLSHRHECDITRPIEIC
jgi:hypothetical protein